MVAINSTLKIITGITFGKYNSTENVSPSKIRTTYSSGCSYLEGRV